MKAGLYARPALELAALLRASGARVAQAVAGGQADVGALSLVDFLAAVSEGAPLIAIGALTRRFGGQLVVSQDAPVVDRSLAGLLRGGWRGLTCGVQTGADGTERAMRFLLLAHDASPASSAQNLPAAPHLRTASGDAPPAVMGPNSRLATGSGEPRWLGYGAGEGLVAALKDRRIDAFLGRSMAAAQATMLGGSEITANVSDGSVLPEVAGALCTVLIARRDHLEAADASSQRLLAALVGGCARAATALAGPSGAALALNALPERDPLHLVAALRLDAPSAAASVYAAGARIAPDALQQLVELTARAGRPFTADVSSLSTTRFNDSA